MTDSPILRIPCRISLTAAAYGAHLTEQEDIDGVTVDLDNKTVNIPTDNPRFAWDVAQIAVDKGWADDAAVARAVSDFLEGPDGIVTRARQET